MSPLRGWSHQPFRVDRHNADDPLATKSMALKLVKLEKDSKGDYNEDARDFSPVYLLSREQYRRIEALAHRQARPQAPLK